jgi:large subunit ribosomal protein L34
MQGLARLSVSIRRGSAAASVRTCSFGTYSMGFGTSDGISAGEQLQTYDLPALRNLGSSLSGASKAPLFVDNSRVITTPLGLMTGSDQVPMFTPVEALEGGVGKDVSPLDSLLQEAISFIKRTFQPSLIRRKRKHGFLHRMRTKDGRTIMNNRRRKGRRKLCA